MQRIYFYRNHGVGYFSPMENGKLVIFLANLGQNGSEKRSKKRFLASFCPFKEKGKMSNGFKAEELQAVGALAFFAPNV